MTHYSFQILKKLDTYIILHLLLTGFELKGGFSV